LTLWVLLCIAAGIGLGNVLGDHMAQLSTWNVANVNIPVAVLVWLMIFPMMVQIDFSSLKYVSRNWKGLGLTVVVNWLIKPFTMALFAFRVLSTKSTKLG
jgi:ACR3 family arsenite transporter